MLQLRNTVVQQTYHLRVAKALECIPRASNPSDKHAAISREQNRGENIHHKSKRMHHKICSYQLPELLYTKRCFTLDVNYAVCGT